MDPRQFGPSISYYQDPTTGAIDDPRLESSAPTPRQSRYSVRALQCALAARGVNITVDGYYGPQTRTYLQAALRGYQLQASASTSVQAAAFEEGARTNATSIMVADNFAAWLFERAPQCRTESSATPSTARNATTPRSSGSSAITAQPLTLPFWRKDNWKAWAVVVGAAAVLGGGGYYAYKKRWFR